MTTYNSYNLKLHHLSIVGASLIHQVNVDSYKFILERIPVTQKHEDTAKALVVSIIGRRRSSFLGKLPRKSIVGVTAGMGMGLQDMSTISVDQSACDNMSITDSQSVRRTQLLRSLVEPVQLPDDAPPMRIISKGELRLVAFQRDAHHSLQSGGQHQQQQGGTQQENYSTTHSISTHAGSSAAFGGSGSPGLNSSTAPGLLESFAMDNMTAVSPMQSFYDNSQSLTSSKRSLEKLSSLTGGPLSEAMWLTPEELGGGSSNYSIAPAFSEVSLNYGSKEGRIDRELSLVLQCKFVNHSALRTVIYCLVYFNLLLPSVTLVLHTH
jgi:hypothetical protein